MIDAADVACAVLPTEPLLMETMTMIVVVIVIVETIVVAEGSVMMINGDR